MILDNADGSSLEGLAAMTQMNCYGTTGVSYGSIILPAGDHSLDDTWWRKALHGTGAAYFRIDPVVGVPEPLSIMLLGLGLLGLGAVRRSRV